MNDVGILHGTLTCPLLHISETDPQTFFDTERGPLLPQAGIQSIGRLLALPAYLSQPEGYDDIFVGKDLIEGTALSAISRIRALTKALPGEAGKLPPLAERLLASKTDVEIDGLLNGIFRPMIRVPIQMITDAFGKWDDDALTLLQKERIQQQYRR